MILSDTSAALAILYDEPDASYFLDVMEYNQVALPASVLVETGILVTRDGKQQQWQRLLASLGANVIPLDEAIAQKAVAAFEQYGKGRHKASLNFGDCLVYATAKHLDLPLLYKGNDFSRTDVRSPGLPPIQGTLP